MAGVGPAWVWGKCRANWVSDSFPQRKHGRFAVLHRAVIQEHGPFVEAPDQNGDEGHY